LARVGVSREDGLAEELVVRRNELLPEVRDVNTHPPLTQITPVFQGQLLGEPEELMDTLDDRRVGDVLDHIGVACHPTDLPVDGSSTADELEARIAVMAQQVTQVPFCEPIGWSVGVGR